MNLRLPELSGDTATQLRQLKSYLYQLVQELNFALSENVDTPPTPHSSASLTPSPQGEGLGQFNEVKALLIKSADIVEAYCEEITRRLEGRYVAAADFGAYTQKTAAQLTATAEAVTQKYENLQQLLTQLGESMVAVQAYIKTGLLYYDDTGAPVYGMEIGQQTEDTGFMKFARFTADKLAFFNASGVEVACISDGQLQIPRAAVSLSFTRGGYTDEIGPDGSITTRWVGI